MWWFYNSGLWLGTAVGLPLSMFNPKMRHYIKHRLGNTLTQDCPFFLFHKQPVWFHALSVGEVLSVVPLVKKFRQHWWQIPIFFTASTLTGHKIALKQLKNIVTAIGYFPLDLPPVITRYFKRVNPRLIVLTETDIWPNFLNMTKKRHIPCLLINARMSERSYKRYRLIKPWFTQVINCLDFVGVQRGEDAERFLELGLEEKKIKIIGNLKFDKPLPNINEAQIKQLKMELGLLPEQPVWIAGSTHRGENEIILKVHKALLRLFPELCLIIAPRHPERFDEVTKLALQSGFRTRRRTESKEGKWEVIILDTLGELAQMYAVADFAFIGGSFVPIGGHNPLEAAVWGKPVVFGPYMFNFSEIATLMQNKKAACQIKHETELFQIINTWLKQPKLAQEMGENGRALIKTNQGVGERYLEIINTVMNSNSYEK
ncbi:MAG: 3-deoxy-D-manno-octulosonic acid transferase [Candidatus Desulfofervidaceae bacterium]|nr:3-deoxy-D-manno-octulosonic acid transferase [Candidatus Desulfofervidaceae bacterium]